MKIRFAFAVLLVAISAQKANAESVSDLYCSSYEDQMLNAVLPYRTQGFPVSVAENIFNSEKDVTTRVFLKQVTRAVYADPQAGRDYLKSGRFRKDCLKTHRGY